MVCDAVGGTCKLGSDCGHVVGGTQISPIQEAQFRDDLTGKILSEVISSPSWPADIMPRTEKDINNIGDIFTVVSAIAQILQVRSFDCRVCSLILHAFHLTRIPSYAHFMHDVLIYEDFPLIFPFPSADILALSAF